MKYWLLLLPLVSCLSIAQNKVFLVTEQLPPLSYVDKQGQVRGDATERVQQLMHHAGLDYSIEVLPWKRAYKQAESSANTLIFTILKTPTRSERFDWLCPLVPPLEVYLYKLKNRHDLAPSSLADAKSSLVGASRGSVAHSLLLNQGFIEGKNLMVTTNIDVLTQNLRNGRLDYVLLINTSVHDTDNITAALPENFSRDLPACLAINKQSDPQIKQRLMASFTTLSATNFHQP